MSNLARFIAQAYLAARAASIVTIGLAFGPGAGMAAAQNPMFCVLVPHFKDEYWLSVGYGLEQEAARQSVDLLLFEAGGYNALDQQIAQLGHCAAQGVDAILIGAVSSDDPALISAVANVAQKVPVFSLVNALHSDALAGKIGVDWREMGYAIGRYLTKLHPAGSPPKTAVFISGPPAAGWTEPLEVGLRDGLVGSAVKIIDVMGADTGLRHQLPLVETALERHPDVDFLIGSAPSIEAAIGIFAAKANPTRPMLLSTYISHTVLRGLMNGNVLAVAFDDPMKQGVMAIRQAMSAGTSAGFPQTIGPKIVILNRAGENMSQIHLSPSDYFPAIQ